MVYISRAHIVCVDVNIKYEPKKAGRFKFVIIITRCESTLYTVLTFMCVIARAFMGDFCDSTCFYGGKGCFLQ